MDKLTPARRSENMRRIRSKDTGPDLVVRWMLRALAGPGVLPPGPVDQQRMSDPIGCLGKLSGHGAVLSALIGNPACGAI